MEGDSSLDVAVECKRLSAVELCLQHGMFCNSIIELPLSTIKFDQHTYEALNIFF